MGTVTQSKKEGDISSVFVSLSGKPPPPLPNRFADVKKELASGHKEKLTASWKRLLKEIEKEVRIISNLGPAVIPSIDFKALVSKTPDFYEELKRRGVAVVRGVVPRDEARAYKEEIERYVKANPSTKGNIWFFRFKNVLTKRQLSQRITPVFLSYTGPQHKSKLAHIQTS
jgi:hypothetical protein